MSRCTTVVFGLFFGAIISVLTAFLFGSFAQTAAGGMTSLLGESWLYLSLAVPFTLTFAVLGGYIYNRTSITNKKLWLISLISAFFVTLYSGTIGAIFGEAIVRGGMKTINIDGTLGWGTIYAFVLLPFTVPFARLLIGLFVISLERAGLRLNSKRTV